uniref:Methionyl-tRNA formyltransferase, mitochondrial n=1 Tax=Culicoides sonorensis TaxID=179676 RepID=A0A336MQT9_CULSO
MRILFQLILRKNTLRQHKRHNFYDKNVRNYCDINHKIDYKSLKVLFFGTDTFSLSSLVALHTELEHDRNIKVLDVVTSFRAMSNPIKDYAQKENLKLFDFKSIKSKESLDYDLGLVVSFGHLIPEQIINEFPLGMLNVHGSLLPKYRGAAPIIYAIRNGDTKTGITIMRIKPKHFDTGEILCQKEFAISDTELMPDLHHRLATEGAKLLIDCINAFPLSLTRAIPQNESEVTYAPKIDENFTQVRWNTMTAKDVFNLYRSLYSFKFCSTTWHGLPVKFKEMSYHPLSPCTENIEPGTVIYCQKLKCLQVFCANGQAIHVHDLGIGKKSKISAFDFNNGFLKKRPESERKFTS